MHSLHATDKHLHDLVCVNLCLVQASLGPFQGEPVASPPLRLKHFSHLPLALDDLSSALLLLGDEGQVHVKAAHASHSLKDISHLPVLGLETGQALQACFCIPAVAQILGYMDS